MSSISSAAPTTSKNLHPQTTSSSPIRPPKSKVNNTEPASIGGGVASQDLSNDKTFAGQLRLSSPGKDYSGNSFGTIAEGHYTEF